jgi:hypothetical protein
MSIIASNTRRAAEERSSKLAGEEQFLLEHWKKMQSLEIACGLPAPAEMHLLLIWDFSCLRLDNNWLTVYPFSPSHTVISCVNLRCTCCTVVLRYDGEMPRPYQNAAPPIRQVINHIISAAPRHYSGPSPLSFTFPPMSIVPVTGLTDISGGGLLIGLLFDVGGAIYIDVTNRQQSRLYVP